MRSGLRCLWPGILETDLARFMVRARHCNEKKLLILRIVRVELVCTL